jgi:hypothetical protein
MLASKSTAGLVLVDKEGDLGGHRAEDATLNRSFESFGPRGSGGDFVDEVARTAPPIRADVTWLLSAREIASDAVSAIGINRRLQLDACDSAQRLQLALRRPDLTPPLTAPEGRADLGLSAVVTEAPDPNRTWPVMRLVLG